VLKESGAVSIGSEHLSLLKIVPAADELRAEGQLWRYPYDGSKAELVARRATRGRTSWLDGRIVTPVEVDESWVGELVIVEPGTLAEGTIDARVHGRASYAELSGDLEPDALAYMVRDGDRTGVWVARPAVEK
jgi:hypothetical protein